MAKPAKTPEWDSGELNTVEPTASHKASGWLLPGGVPEKPTLQEYNYWMNNVYKWINEVNQVGVLSWDAITTYGIGAYVVGSNFRLFRSLTAGNQNNDPVGDPVNWLDVLNDASALVGEIKSWPLPSIPSGFLECDGSAISRATYADLFAELGTAYGIGDGSTTFNIPDYRGEFLRGLDNGAGNDPDAGSRTDRGDGTTGDNVGTKQADVFESHDHTGAFTGTNLVGGGGSDPGTTATTTGTAGGNETRPRNVNIIFMIKY